MVAFRTAADERFSPLHGSGYSLNLGADLFEPGALVIDDILTKHSESRLASKNEAATRLHVIDRILFEALGWTRDSCEPEAVVKGRPGGFLDYALAEGTEQYVVVEAKRSGKTFEIPKEKDNREYVLSTLLGFCGDTLAEVLEQAHQYAASLGVPFAAATNGHQWIIFRP